MLKIEVVIMNIDVNVYVIKYYFYNNYMWFMDLLNIISVK